MRVLVGYASKHGSTREIAERIAAGLKQAGQVVELRSIAEPCDANGFDAYVLGSSVYLGHWNRGAVDFVHRNGALLSRHPVWLFSSGPLAGQERADPAELGDLSATVQLREHRLFGGALRSDRMSFAERLMAKALKVSGDAREWDAIEAWADRIQADLRAAAVGAPAGSLAPAG